MRNKFGSYLTDSTLIQIRRVYIFDVLVTIPIPIIVDNSGKFILTDYQTKGITFLIYENQLYYSSL